MYTHKFYPRADGSARGGAEVESAANTAERPGACMAKKKDCSSRTICINLFCRRRRRRWWRRHQRVDTVSLKWNLRPTKTTSRRYGGTLSPASKPRGVIVIIIVFRVRTRLRAHFNVIIMTIIICYLFFLIIFSYGRMRAYPPFAS